MRRLPHMSTVRRLPHMSTVRRLPHRRMATNRTMRRSRRGAHPMRQVRAAIMNDTFAKDRADAERLARRPAAQPAPAS